MPVITGNSGGNGEGLDPSVAQSLQNQINKNSDSIANLESISGLAYSKFYILPNAGQSNGVGYGETAAPLINHPRIKQLGRYTTASAGSGHSVTEAQFGYGDRMEEFRPFDDANLQIIPASNCLDNVQQMFQYQAGGTAGFAQNLAIKMLELIPDDYGILIIPCCRGGSAFTTGASGTYDSSRKSASETSQKWGVGEPLYNDLKDRVSHALDLNPENRLLPLIWTQGEFDQGTSDIALHLNAFLAMYDDFYNHISANYSDRLVDGDINNFRWYCLSSTKWMWGADLQLRFEDVGVGLDHTVSANYSRSPIYSNYIYASNMRKNSFGKKHIKYVRIDTDENGDFVQTNREKGNGVTTSTRQIHFNTKANLIDIPRLVFNAICNDGGFPKSSSSAYHMQDSRSINKRYQTNGTDNKSPIRGKMPSDDGLILHQNFSVVSSVSENLVTESGATAIAISASSPTLVVDPDFGQVLDMAGDQYLGYNMAKGTTSYTKWMVFRQDSADTSKNSRNLMSAIDNTRDGVIWSQKGSVSAYVNYNRRTEGMRENACDIYDESLEFTSWRAIAVTFNNETKVANMYAFGEKTGRLIASTKINQDPNFNSVHLGNYSNATGDITFKGQFARVRLYDRELSEYEINGLAENDLLSVMRERSASRSRTLTPVSPVSDIDPNTQEAIDTFAPEQNPKTV